MIETKRLLLCRPKDIDKLIISGLWKDKEVRRFLGGCVADEVITEKIIELSNHWDLYKFGMLAVFKKTSKEIIGICGLHYSPEGIELSYMFFPNSLGKGFASEAIVACIDHGFNTLKIEKITAITQSLNMRSMKILDKIGMKHIKNFERYNASQSLFELKSNEWLKVKG